MSESSILWAAAVAMLFSPRIGARLWAEVQYALGGKVRWQLPVWSAASVVVVVIWSATAMHALGLYASYWWALFIASSFALLLAAPAVWVVFSKEKVPNSVVKQARGGAKSRTRSAQK